MSNYPTGDLSESQDNSTDSDSDDSDNGSETESEFDGRPAQKKQNGRSVISSARKMSMEHRTIGYNGVPRWCQNVKWGRQGL